MTRFTILRACFLEYKLKGLCSSGRHGASPHRPIATVKLLA